MIDNYTERLRRTLEQRSVRLMGPHSPFWRCEYCDAAHTSPINFTFDQHPVGIHGGYTWASPYFKQIFGISAKVTNGLNPDGSEIVGESTKNGKDFWEAVYEPYSHNRIPRDVVRIAIDKSRAVAGKGMPQIARYLKAVSGDLANDDEERKRFFKFKNFLYKTVKIS